MARIRRPIRRRRPSLRRARPPVRVMRARRRARARRVIPRRYRRLIPGCLVPLAIVVLSLLAVVGAFRARRREIQ